MNPQAYSSELFFQVGCFISHPVFGVGQVIKHIHPNKMNVDFTGEVKCLVCRCIPLESHPEKTTLSLKNRVRALSSRRALITRKNHGLHEETFHKDLSNYVVPQQVKNTAHVVSNVAPLRYDPDLFFPLRSLITHPALGEGQVLGHIHPNKMNVDFAGEIKCLVCSLPPKNAQIKTSLEKLASSPDKVWSEYPLKIKLPVPQKTDSPADSATIVEALQIETTNYTASPIAPLEHSPQVCDSIFEVLDILAVNEDRALQTAVIPVFQSQSATSNSSIKLDNMARTTLINILSQHFPNGIRPSSIIDIKKLQKYYTKETGICITEEVDDIPSLLSSVGLTHGGKIYIVSNDDALILITLVKKMLLEGQRLFFYDEFYTIHAELLYRMNIFSSELLKSFFVKYFRWLIHIKNYSISPYQWNGEKYCFVGMDISVESEIHRYYETIEILSYDQLKEKMPYVPLAVIKQKLVCKDCFIWVSHGVYTHIGKIKFDKVECRTVCTKIEDEVLCNGFASLASVNVDLSLQLNPTLSEAAIREGLFQVYLADRMEKRGNIISPKGTILNSVAVIENYCRSHECLSLDELLEFERGINGVPHNQSLLIAYEAMIRANKDTFIADWKIQFDIGAVDEALSRFMVGNVIPLKAIKSFTTFPHIVGYPWNLFLLESYCRRFSERFSFHCLSVNSRNVGAIVKKTTKFANYAEALATVVVSEAIKLNTEAVGDFLFEEGYVARRTNFVAEVVAQAQLLRARIN